MTDTTATPTEQRIRADIAQLTAKLGTPPTELEYASHGDYAVETVKDHLGVETWGDVLDKIGSKNVTQDGRIPTAKIKADIHQVAEQLGGPPTMGEYTENGQYSPETIKNRIGDGKWSTALQKLGFDLSSRQGVELPPDERPTKDDIRADILRVKEQLEHIPSGGDYQEHGRYSYHRVQKIVLTDDQLNRWKNTLENLGIN